MNPSGPLTDNLLWQQYSQRQDGHALNQLTQRYQQKIYALVFYLIGGDRDAAYRTAAASFAEVYARFQKQGSAPDSALPQLAEAAVAKSRRVEILPAGEIPPFTAAVAAPRRPSLDLLRRKLHTLPFDSRALLILRDQMHLNYHDISVILNSSERALRTDIITARKRLRESLEEHFKHGL